MIWIQLVCFAALAAGVVRLVLILWPPTGAKLPHPSKVPGMPMAGPASQQAAHAALIGKRRT